MFCVKERIFYGDQLKKIMKKFIKKHWIDALVLLAVAAFIAFGCYKIGIKFNFVKKWNIFVDYFITNKGYKKLIEGLKNTGLIAVSGLIIGIFIGTIIAVIRVTPSYKKITRYAQNVCTVYVAFFRGTPLVVQLLVGYFILLPLIGLQLPQVTSCCIIFGLNSGAYISEIMRGGINSVDKGQLEAARAMGLGYWTSMLKVVIPQAIKNILPTLGNEFIALVKETAVVGYVGAVDITKSFQDLGSSSYEYMIPYLMMALLYIVIVALIAALVKMMERRLSKSERK